MPKKKTTEVFVEQAVKIHNGKYDYSKVEYINNTTKVCIICPIHGEFWQTPHNHLNNKGCPKCANKGIGNDERIELCNKIHDGKYDYSKSDFSNVKSKTIIICPIHGEFLMDFNHHKNNKCGCPKCARNAKLSYDEYEKKANEIHRNEYEYFHDYETMHKKIKIKCKIHGIFYQQAQAHLRGQCCPKCITHSKLEDYVRKALNENNFEYEEQKKFDWLGNKSLDFYIPKYNVAIECQGKQHFGLGGWNRNKEKREEYLKTQKNRDIEKYNTCKEHNLEILYFSNIKPNGNYFSKVYTNENNLINKLKNIK